MLKLLNEPEENQCSSKLQESKTAKVNKGEIKDVTVQFPLGINIAEIWRVRRNVIQII